MKERSYIKLYKLYKGVKWHTHFRVGRRCIAEKESARTYSSMRFIQAT